MVRSKEARKMTKKKKSILRYFTPMVGGIYLLKDTADNANKLADMELNIKKFREQCRKRGLLEKDIDKAVLALLDAKAITKEEEGEKRR